MRSLIAAPVVAWAVLAGGSDAIASDIDIAIKNGETMELTRLYFISNCRSNLKSPPTAEILDGPNNLSISVKEGMVLPRAQRCSKEVSGGILSLSAKDISEVSTIRLIVRVKYETRDGIRFRSHNYNVTMVP